MSETTPVGRPGYEPTEENKLLVSKMMSYGVSLETISKCLEISVPTLYKYYRYELDTARANCIVKVADRLMSKIENYDGPSIMFYLKTQGKWREKDGETDEERLAREKQDRINQYVLEQLNVESK